MAMNLAMNFAFEHYVRIILGVGSAISGLIFLSLSAFFKLQFDDTKALKIMLFAIFSALIVFLIFMAPNWTDVLRKVCDLNFSAKLTVDCVFMGIVWILSFLIKYPRFDVHWWYKNSCPVDEQAKRMLNGSQYSLFSVGAFALLALLLSSERQKTLELGFFGVLIGLIMDTSMEIPRTNHDGPNGWYILVSVVYCVCLIFLKHYIESLMGNGDDYIVLAKNLKLYKIRSFKEVHRNGLVFFLALVGIVCLFLSPSSEQQFEDYPNLKGVCFITFALLLGFCLLKAREFIDVLVVKCHKSYLMKAGVKILLLVVVSVAIFMTKYPRFRIQSKYRESCGDTNGKKVIMQRNQFDMFSTGSFSLLALTMSCGREQPVKLGIFGFLLELTMDTSIEILGNHKPNLLYPFFASFYCALLILSKSYFDSLADKKHKRSYQDQPENVNAKERHLIDMTSVEERAHEIEDIETGADRVDNAHTAEEDSESEHELWDVRDFQGSSAYREDETKLLSQRERNIAKRREKTKREKERLKRRRKNKKDDLWIS